MDFRNIIISSPAKLSIRYNQLSVKQEQEVLIPVDDICTLLIESQQVQITAAALEILAAAGVTVFFCDNKHLPSAQILPINRFNRQKKMLYAQFELGKTLQKNLWQTVVKRKIKNQSLCLKFLNKPGWQELDEMANSVKSGDTENVEAVAAAYYFPKLFGAGFVREDDRIENSAMNYGYAVIRGGIARNLVMHGLEPCIGIHHHSELNNFNLADDMIEPYRPLVDLMVATEHFDSDLDSDLTPELKKKLFNVTNYLLFQKGKRVRAMTSIDRSTASLAKSVTESETLLELPELIPLEEGRYE